MFALKEKIKFLNREDFMCVFKKECDYVDNEEINFCMIMVTILNLVQNFFGNKIYEINWLQLN